jgi:NAD(P)-dependent dehydrogenase (short-subunit alcohol dehydrogenase family)
MPTPQVWLVTGSSRGLGLALAQAVLAKGDRLVATARNPEHLADLARRHGDRVRSVALDVTSAALPVLRAQRSGHVIQISSIGGRHGSPGLAAYQAAKWAVEGFSEVLAREVAPLGIRVTIAEPGGIRTDWAGSSMRVDAVRDDYEPTVGAFMDNVRKSHNATRGDPAKMAQALLQVAALPEPPLRFLLGSDAVFVADLVAKQRAAEDEKWRPLSVTTDFDGLVDFAETSVAKMLAGMTQGG